MRAAREKLPTSFLQKLSQVLSIYANKYPNTIDTMIHLCYRSLTRDDSVESAVPIGVLSGWEGSASEDQVWVETGSGLW